MQTPAAEPVFDLDRSLPVSIFGFLVTLSMTYMIVADAAAQFWLGTLLGVSLLGLQIVLVMGRYRIRLGAKGFIYLVPFPLKWSSYKRFDLVERDNGRFSKLGFSNVRVGYTSPRLLRWISPKYLRLKLRPDQVDAFIEALTAKIRQNQSTV